MYEYIGILLGARPILHIIRIKVKKLGNARCGLLATATVTTNDVASGGLVTNRDGSQKTWIFEDINVAQDKYPGA
jgi:hypothetical protein